MSFAQDLRASVLQAAMQGKLTEQLETDTAVCEMLNNYNVKLSEIEEDVPFDIAEHWEWVNHNNIFSIIGGSQPAKSHFSETQKDGYVRLYQIRDYGTHPVPVFVDKKLVSKFSKKGDIMLARYGASLGKIFWAEDGAYNVALAKATPLYDGLMDMEFMFYYYHSSIYQNFIKKASRSAQAGFNKSDLKALSIPVPPIEEQKRIVRRIEEIMKHIDELEAIEEELKKLKEAFPADMKAAVLQAAMQGKLTEQLETDSSVDDLLENIKVEREKLIAEGKIKKPRIKQNDNFVELDDVPFDIPSSWKWVSLSSIAYTNGGYAFQSSKYSKEGTRVVRISDFNNDKLLFSQIVRYPFSKDLEQYVIKANDILMCMTGGTVGKCCLIDTIPEQMVTNQRVANISTVLVQPRYLHYVLKSSVIQDIIKQNKNSTNDNISMDLILSFPIPLPSIEEQQRIVDKLETILPLIENI